MMAGEPSREPARGRWLGAALLAALVLLVANLPLVVGTGAPRWDASEQFAPSYILLADHARAGRLLLWNPWSNAGVPDAVEPQYGAFSPLTVGMAALTGGSEAGYRAYWLALWLLGGFGVLALGRHLGAPAWGGAVAALGFMLSGFLTGHAQHMPWLYTLSFLPFVVWRLDRALLAGRLRPAVEAGALLGLAGVGGYPGLTVGMGMFACLWAAARWGTGATDASSGRLRPLAALVLLFVTAGLVLAPTWVGFAVETRGYTDRSGSLPREVAVGQNPLEPGALATFASPSLSILRVHNPELWPATDGSSLSVYCGLLVLTLALLALLLRPRDPWRLALVALAALFLALAVGPALPLRGWLYDLFPPSRTFRHPTLFRAFAMFAVTVLALLATRDLAAGRLASRRLGWRLLASAGVVFLAAAAVLIAVMSGVHETGGLAWPAARHLAALAAGTGLAAALLLSSRRRLASLVPTLLVLVAVADAVGTGRLARATILDTGPARQAWDLLNERHDPSIELGEHGLDRALRRPDGFGWRPNANWNLPLKLPVLDSYVTLTNRFHREIADSPSLAAMALGRDRFWFSDATARLELSEPAFAGFAARVDEAGGPVIALHDRGELLRGRPAGDGLRQTGYEIAHSLARAEPAQRISIELETYRPTELVLRVEAPRDGWLLATERWARGWRASVNGRPREVVPACFVFRAVAVEAGANRIAFRYRPFGYPALLVLSWGTLLAVAAAALSSRLRSQSSGSSFARR